MQQTVTPDFYRLRFKDARKEGAETFTQFLVRMEGLLKKRALMQGKDVAVASDIWDLLMEERLMNMMTPNLAIRVREQAPKDAKEAAECANQILQAWLFVKGALQQPRRGGRTGPSPTQRQHHLTRTTKDSNLGTSRASSASTANGSDTTGEIVPDHRRWEQCKRTKTTHVIQGSLAPAFTKPVTERCKTGPFSLTTDESNDKNEAKCLAILVRVFDERETVQKQGFWTCQWCQAEEPSKYLILLSRF